MNTSGVFKSTVYLNYFFIQIYTWNCSTSLVEVIGFEPMSAVLETVMLPATPYLQRTRGDSNAHNPGSKPGALSNYATSPLVWTTGFEPASMLVYSQLRNHSATSRYATRGTRTPGLLLIRQAP